eukprot:jgi/Bigna1/141358/aug1.62_g16066
MDISSVKMCKSEFNARVNISLAMVQKRSESGAGALIIQFPTPTQDILPELESKSKMMVKAVTFHELTHTLLLLRNPLITDMDLQSTNFELPNAEDVTNAAQLLFSLRHSLNSRNDDDESIETALDDNCSDEDAGHQDTTIITSRALSLNKPIFKNRGYTSTRYARLRTGYAQTVNQHWMGDVREDSKYRCRKLSSKYTLASKAKKSVSAKKHSSSVPKKKILSKRIPTTKEHNKLIEALERHMKFKRLNQSEISKIVHVPQPYISMFLNRRWRGSFESPTWIHMEKQVTAWLRSEGEEVPGDSIPKELEKEAHPSKREGQGRVVDNLNRVQVSVSTLFSLPDIEKQTPRCKYADANKKCPSKKGEEANVEIRSPILKPGALPYPPRSKLHMSFFDANSADQEGERGMRSPHQSWYCKVCTFINEHDKIECKYFDL